VIVIVIGAGLGGLLAAVSLIVAGPGAGIYQRSASISAEDALNAAGPSSSISIMSV
jgi:predicted NAD/FAD-dependent oxidoreductase